MIKIRSQLSDTQYQRLRRRAALYAERSCAYSQSFIHIGPGTYAPLYDEQDAHDVARHMMVVCGRPFDYDVC